MKRILLTYCLLLTAILAWSQSTVATGVPYECSFETDQELNAWVLNPLTPAAHDKWMVGTAVHSEGKRALYVSANGSNPSFSDHRNVVAAYLMYQFPSSGSYDISFDWRGMGSIASSLHVMICPVAQLTTPGSQYELASFVSSNAQLPNNVPLSIVGQNGETSLHGSETWQNVSVATSVGSLASTMPFAIVFIWENQLNANKDSIQLAGFAIDNLQINNGDLKKPMELEVDAHCEDSTLLVSWVSSGAANEFDVQYRQTGAPTWRNAGSGLTVGASGFNGWSDANGVRHYSYSIPRILEGSYDVRVRASYDGDLRTGWTYLSLNLMYCPDNHCVNYIDLYSPSVVCTYGSNPVYRPGESPFDNIGVVDFGPDNELSRHTLHVDLTELDPRTDSMLHTVPDGALASVRLGNWKTGGEAESITYDITVDSAHQGILIVQYAVVLEKPGDWHKHEEEPRFELVVLDSLGNPIDDLCGRADFYYSDGVAAGWNMTKDGQVAWKDWTTVGLNLMPYNGQSIKVRFITYDCGQGGHYGYAYFTVDCANAHIETQNCGTDARINCKAPDGFAYTWYNELGQVVSTEQELDVEAGRQTYTCRVSFIDEPNCYFEVSTISAPRFPVPEYTVQNIFSECQSKLKFHNTSHVMNKFDGIENHTSEECVDFHWEIKRLSDGVVKPFDAKEPSYVCPAEGDSLEITYTCYFGVDNACDSTRVDTIVVPSIFSDTTRTYYSTCPEQPVKFDGQWFDKDTVYVGRFTNFAECDSLSILYLDVFPEVKDIHRHDSICDDQSLIINGVKYNTPLDDYLIMLKTVHDCDSAIYLTLTVNERIKQSLDTVPYACADEQNLYIPLMIDKGVFDSLSISFSTPELRDTVIYTNVNEVNIPYPADITPGSYTATFTYYQFCCGTHTFTRTIDVRYRSSIVEQKWNDVLTLLSPKYNGGFEFTAYQWYKDGMPLLGENHSYLYQPLDENSYYYVELTRADGVTITTCPIQPVHHEDQTPFPTLVTGGKRIPMYMAYPTTIWYYTMSGQLYSTFDMQQGYTDLVTPAQPGVYIIKSVNTQGETQAQTMIVE